MNMSNHHILGAHGAMRPSRRLQVIDTALLPRQPPDTAANEPMQHMPQPWRVLRRREPIDVFEVVGFVSAIVGLCVMVVLIAGWLG